MANKSAKSVKARLARRKKIPLRRGVHRLVKDLLPYRFTFQLDYASLKVLNRSGETGGTENVPPHVRYHFRELFKDIARQNQNRPSGVLFIELGWHTQEPLDEIDDAIFCHEFDQAIKAAQQCWSYNPPAKRHTRLGYYVRTVFGGRLPRTTETRYPSEVGKNRVKKHIDDLSLERATAPGISPGDAIAHIKEAIAVLSPEHQRELHGFLTAQVSREVISPTERGLAFSEAVQILREMPDRIRSAQIQIKDECQAALSSIAGQHLDTYEENRQLTQTINTIRRLLGVAFRDQEGRRVSLSCVDVPGWDHGRFDIKPGTGKRTTRSQSSFHRLELYYPSK